MNSRRLGVGSVLVAVLLTASACGDPDSAPDDAPVVKPPAATVETTTAKPATPATAAKIKVPDGVGLNYQAAQDLWRAEGLHVAPAKDATGANRIPVLDRNWIVVSQDPEAGATVDAGSFITATVKKDTDG
ncbi:PASTA domain-containing protein [Actinoplanes italicus]|uniref:PASTA domain-containing protein n=1 Tax=Actinoplanes italicus TaxID=113567 RepID=A0A2T0JRE3_9ACTN|nr:PASTA domain-containing protein [Actinoplanes italicus]PRX10185.1 PASTA domain-containing protein [Actinoplanes italicus]GIE34892.1 PASTA domain-containing protein [Actinoplanes italicus]